MKGITVLASVGITQEEVDSIIDGVMEIVDKAIADGLKEYAFKYEKYAIDYGFAENIGQVVMISLGEL